MSELKSQMLYIKGKLFILLFIIILIMIILMKYLYTYNYMCIKKSSTNDDFIMIKIDNM